MKFSRHADHARRHPSPLLPFPLETLETRIVFDAPHDFAAVGIRYEGGPRLFHLEGVVDANDAITGDMRFADATGVVSTGPSDWTSLTRGDHGAISFGPRSGFTPYDSQTGTNFIGEERWEMGSFVGRGVDGAARDVAFLLTPSTVTSTSIFLDMRMTRITAGGALESFRMVVFPSFGNQSPGGNVFDFTYFMSSGATTVSRSVISIEDGRWEFDTGEVIYVNQAAGEQTIPPAILVDFNASDGIVGVAVGGNLRGGGSYEAGRYRANVVVEGPVGAAMFGLDPQDVQNGNAVASVVIELNFWSNNETDSVPNTFAIYRQSEWDAGDATPVAQGTWGYGADLIPVPPFASPRFISLLAPDSVSVRVQIVNRTLVFNSIAQDDTAEQLQGIASAILARPGDLIEITAAADADGNPIAYLTYGSSADDAQVYTVNLADEVGGESVRGPLITWSSTSGIGLARYVAGLSQTGDLLLWRLLPDDVSWSFVNLTDSIAGAQPIVSDLFSTGLVTAANYESFGILPAVGARQMFGGYAADGDFVVYNLARQFIPQYASPWRFTDLGETGVGGAGFVPEVVGGWSGWNTAWGASHFAGIDANGELWALWFATGLDRWHVSSLTAAANLPELTPARPATLVTDWNAMHVAAVDTNGHLVVAWWTPAEDVWRGNDLTAEHAGPTLQADSLVASFTYGLGTLNFAGRDDQGAARVYWWTTTGGWQVDTISRDVAPSDLPLQPWTMSWSIYTLGSTRHHGQSLYGRNADGDVVRLVWRSSLPDQWILENVSLGATPFFV